MAGSQSGQSFTIELHLKRLEFFKDLLRASESGRRHVCSNEAGPQRRARRRRVTRVVGIFQPHARLQQGGQRATKSKEKGDSL
jgi:hypothetical protein